MTLPQLPADVRGKRILDLGCGSGQLCAMMAKNGARQVLGVDLAQPAAAADWTFVKLDLEADDRATPVRLVAGHGRPGDGFDWVFACGILERLSAPARFLAQIRTLLAPGGQLLLTTPNVNAWRRPPPDETQRILFTKDSLALLLARTGFRVQAVRVPFGKAQLIAYANA
jgi:2-polyprenyl-3-methyl-5-hydroxy-6-metoxy-1,4-benzoquinol methylase